MPNNLYGTPGPGSNSSYELDNVIRRLQNSFGSAEGSILPGRQQGDTRVPRVTGLKMMNAATDRGGTCFTLSWLHDSVPVTCFLITPTVSTVAGKKSYLPVTVPASPANVIVPVAGGVTVTFTVQAVLATGLSTPISEAPVISGVSRYPVWYPASLLNSWVNYGAGWEECGYMLDYNGFVHVRGLIKNGTIGGGDDIFVLPPQMRPKLGHLFACAGNTLSAQYVHVLPTGVCEIGNVVNNGHLSLEFQFSVE